MKKVTMAQAQEAARKAPQYVLYSNEFGFDIYIADTELSKGSPITDKIEEALKYAVGYDNQEIKLGWWRAYTGYDLKVVNVEPTQTTN